jgi:hypothetical protein
MKLRTMIAVMLATVALAAAGALVPSVAGAAPTWADADSATIHPGVMTFTEGAQCTANFVFTNGTDVFIGQAAHCSGTGAANETNGCLAGTLPEGTPVEISGASRPGVMVYNSWVAMQEAGETDTNTCMYNDFALVRIDPADHGKVNPSIPFWGGPVGVGDATAPLEEVYSYGNSSLRLGLEPLSPKTGYSLGTTGGGWTHPVYTASPGIPGDSGSAFLDRQGKAIGVLSTLALAPLPASNNVSDLAHALAYMQQSGTSATLVNGTEPFVGTSGLVGSLLG